MSLAACGKEEEKLLLAACGEKTDDAVPEKVFGANYTEEFDILLTEQVICGQGSGCAIIC